MTHETNTQPIHPTRNLGVALALTLALGACGSESDQGSSSGAQKDTGGQNEPGGNASMGFALEALVHGTRALSQTRADRFWVTAFASNDRFYAAGFVTHLNSAGVPDRQLALARFDLTGTLDTTFGEVDPQNARARLGWARINLGEAGSEPDTVETARAIAVQEDGKVLVGGTYVAGVSSTTSLPEANVAIVRFNSDGSLDDKQGGFSVGDADGVDGVLKVDIAPAASHGTQTINDDVGGLSIDSKKRIVLYARGASSSGVDGNRYVLRFDQNGAVDRTFGAAGRHEFSTRGVFNDNAKQGAILADDAILSPGYTSIDGKNHVVIIKIDAKGNLVDTFADQGALVINPFLRATPAASGFAECYAVAIQSDGSLVTTGYGRDIPDPTSSAPNQLVSFRFSADGQLDLAWGPREGSLVLDAIQPGVAPGNIQGRNLVRLPDDRIVMVGNGIADAADSDGQGMVVVLTRDGQLDTTFEGRGYATYDFGLEADALYGVAVSPDGKHVAAAGYAGVSPTIGEVDREDAAIAVFSVP